MHEHLLSRLAKCVTKLAVLCIFLIAASASVFASPVGVSYTVSGSSGDWTLNFSVTNNVNSGQDMYFFGVLLPAQDVINSPAGSVNFVGGSLATTWNPSTNDSASLCSNPLYAEFCGGPNISYNNLWRNFDSPGGLTFGNTLSGFEVEVNSLTAPTAVQWFAYSYDPTATFNPTTGHL
ncbi:MAG: hypothetical protein WA855_14945 [Candidatus Acidiferrales bacterium]